MMLRRRLQLDAGLGKAIRQSGSNTVCRELRGTVRTWHKPARPQAGELHIYPVSLRC